MDAQTSHADDTSHMPAGAQDPERSVCELAPAQEIELPQELGIQGKFPSVSGPREPVPEETLLLPEVDFVPGQHDNLPAPADYTISRASPDADRAFSGYSINDEGPSQTQAYDAPTAMPGPQDPISWFPEPGRTSDSPFRSAHSRPLNRMNSSSEESDDSFLGPSHSFQPDLSSVIVVGISSTCSSERATLLGLLKVLLPNVRQVLQADSFADSQKLRKKLIASRKNLSPALHMRDREILSSVDSKFCLPSGIDEKALGKRLRAQIRELGHVPIVMVEGASLYDKEEIRELIDVRIFIFEDRGLPWAPAMGSLYVENGWEGGKRLTGYHGEHRLETVVWKDCEGQDGSEGSKGQDTQQVMERIGMWALQLVLSMVRERRELEGQRDSGYQFCDCGDGVIGKMRKWIFDRL